MLKEYDKDTEVVIAEYRKYGSDFIYEVSDVGEDRYDNWDGENLAEDGTCIQIVLGSQIGNTIVYD